MKFEVEITVNNWKWEYIKKEFYISDNTTTNTWFIANPIASKSKKWFSEIEKDEFNSYVRKHLGL